MSASITTITLERRDDGGLRVYSDDLPGLILSGPDPQKVMADVWPAIQFLTAYAAGRSNLSERLPEKPGWVTDIGLGTDDAGD